jgi:hypothetical protein
VIDAGDARHALSRYRPYDVVWAGAADNRARSLLGVADLKFVRFCGTLVQELQIRSLRAGDRNGLQIDDFS